MQVFSDFLERRNSTSVKSIQTHRANAGTLKPHDNHLKMNAVTIRGLRSVAVLRSPIGSPRLMSFAVQRQYYSSLPTIAQASFWKQLIPKPLRRGKDGKLPVANVISDARKAKEWNPATFFIFFFLFIGSMAIQMIALKKDFDTFMRQSEVKIGLLKEVIERIQKGEEVDVEGTLGTGDPTKESEWDSGAYTSYAFGSWLTDATY